MAQMSFSRRALAALLHPSPRWWFSAPFWSLLFFFGAVLLSPAAFPTLTNSVGVHVYRVFRDADGFKLQDNTLQAEVWQVRVHSGLLQRGAQSTISLLVETPACIEREQFAPPRQAELAPLERDALLDAVKGPSHMSDLLAADPSWAAHVQSLATIGGGAAGRMYLPVMVFRAGLGLMFVGMSACVAIGFGRHSQRVFYRSVLRNAQSMRCPGCGYDMKGLEKPLCPECGADFWKVVRSAERAIGKVLGDP